MNAKQLRDSILQYAMQGKLIEQNPKDEPVSTLLEKIKDEKEQLIKSKLIKKEKALLPISEGEIPFELPESWEWERLGNISTLLNGDRGKNYPSKQYWIEEGIPFINAGALGGKYLIEEKLNYISEERFNLLGSGFVQKGDLLYCLRGSLGKVAINNKISQGAIASSLVIIRPSVLINNYYLLHVLKSFIGKLMIERVENGTAQPNISAANVKNYLIPIPPISEQKKIVQELDRIEEYIQKYTLFYEEVETKRKQFPLSLEKSILQYAMEGKLTEQDPRDEPANQLIERIKEEKIKLVEQKVIKKEKPLPPIREDEILFDIPETWEWIRLGDLNYIVMGQSPDGNTVGSDKNGMEFHQGKINFDKMYLRNSEIYAEKPSKVAPANSIVMSVRAPVGDVNITEREVCIGRGLCSLKPLGAVSLEYLYYILLRYKHVFEKQSTGSTFKAITATVVKNQPVPLPPLHEQERIVNKINELISITKCLQ